MTEPLRFLALGDSYTIGETVTPEQRWPVQLVNRLREQGIKMANPRIIARTGWTGGELKAALDRATLLPPYDLISLSVGVNNQYRGLPVQDFESEFAALLDQARSLVQDRPGRVLVLSIPDWSRTSFAADVGRQTEQESQAVARFNRVVLEQAVKASAVHVDITASTQNLDTHPEGVADDGLHPSAEQYAHWVSLILSKTSLNQLLKR